MSMQVGVWDGGDFVPSKLKACVKISIIFRDFLYLLVYLRHLVTDKCLNVNGMRRCDKITVHVCKSSRGGSLFCTQMFHS